MTFEAVLDQAIDMMRRPWFGGWQLDQRQTLVVTFDIGRVGREVVGEVIGEVADIIFLTEVKATHRTDILRRADVLLARNTTTDSTPDERTLIGGARTIGRTDRLDWDA